MTPQVYPLIWNGQGKSADGQQQGVVWNPKAPTPRPLAPDPHEPTQDMIIKDQANPGKTPIETQIDKIQQHNDVAANTLCQKNRKRKQSSMELPFDPTIEEGTCYTLSGFAPNFDGKWLITEINYSFSGKTGSRFQIELIQCLAPPVKTPGASPPTGQPTNAPQPIKVPTSPSDINKLVCDDGINSILPRPANASGLTTEPNQTAPTWLNAYGGLNKDQQDLSTENVGPAG